MNSEIETNCAPEKKLERFKPHYSSEYSDDAWEVKVALPGVLKEDLTVSVENEILEIGGLRRNVEPDGWKRLTGSDADRRYELKLDVGPEVDDSKIEAKLEYGELVIRLPLKEEAKPKNIQVT